MDKKAIIWGATGAVIGAGATTLLNRLLRQRHSEQKKSIKKDLRQFGTYKGQVVHFTPPSDAPEQSKWQFAPAYDPTLCLRLTEQSIHSPLPFETAEIDLTPFANKHIAVDGIIAYGWVTSARNVNIVQPEPTSKPIWIIAHRCNNESDIGEALSKGANAIEFDVMSDGSGFVVTHPGPLEIDFHVPTIDEYLDAVIAERERITLLYVDYKGPDFSPQACARLANNVKLQYLGIPSRIKVLFSTADISNRGWFGGLPRKSWVAPQLDENNNPAQVEQFFQASGFSHAWYGDGISELLPEPRRVEKNIKDAIQIRHQEGSIIKGVVIWTLDNIDSMRFYLTIGVNAVLTNDPDDLAGILNGAEFNSRYRKATKEDSPW
jgi:hypothetical protein